MHLDDGCEHSLRPTHFSASPTPPRVQAHFRVLNPRRSPQTLVDSRVQNAFSRIQVRMPDRVGVPEVELADLGHLAGGLYLNGEYSVALRNSDTTPFSLTVSEPPAVSSEAFFAASQSGSALNPAKLTLAASWLLWARR
jgi:hypothetical protein